jgi:hypothetical protein
MSHFCHIECVPETFTVEKRKQKHLGNFRNKHNKNKRKFAQSGHPDSSQFFFSGESVFWRMSVAQMQPP